MQHPLSRSRRLCALVITLLCTLLPALLPTTPVRATPQNEANALTATTVTLIAVEDAGAIESAPAFIGAGYPELILNARPNGDYDHNFIQFDLTDLPADAVIDSAELRLSINRFGGPPLDIETGRIESDWAENTLSWNTQPTVTWGGPIATINATGPLTWPLTSLVQAWQDGSHPNHGIAVRGVNSNGAGASAVSSEGSDEAQHPRLVITYHTPPDEGGPRPDLGDAPDSSNHHGLNNTAYPATGVLGQFPTVWDVPAGQPAGPRHNNQTGEGILGQFLSREAEADLGPDQDGPNNILRNALTGAVGDVANNDRGDDGWRNRKIRFFDCRRQTLTIRVSKAQAATLEKMYLNVWFDGTRDGDWEDTAPCPPPDGGPAQASYEWIVQDYVVDMTAIPAGGFLDIQVNTERVLNATEGQPHWMRFTLSEELSVKPPLKLADGRGPHPGSSLGAYRFGETEDVLQLPPAPGESGELVLEKRVDTASSPVLFGDMVTYEILLRHEGGSQPIQARLRDELPYPLHIHPRLVGGVPRWVIVESPTGGAAPLLAMMDTKVNPPPQPPTQLIQWEGTLTPNSEIKLTFDVHVLPLCGATQQTETIRNLAQARGKAGDPISAEVSFEAACPSYDGIVLTQHGPFTGTLDSLLDLQDLPLQAEVTNSSLHTVTLGLFHSHVLSGTGLANTATDNGRFLERLTLPPGATESVDFTLRLKDELSDELQLPDDFAVTSRLAFCILPGGDFDTGVTCPDQQQYPHLWGEAQPLDFALRPSDLGDAPDSMTNHAAAPMSAYLGIEARFPTVFDPATGLPEGPLHRRPRPFHLGPAVSREAEADIGPDQEGVNNIESAANVADLDAFDDGSRLQILGDCAPASADAQVAISPQAVNWFQAQETKAYLNIWLDLNHDGDWADGFTCQPPNGAVQEVVEHILIDHPVDVVGLGAGLHNLQNLLTRPILWPGPLAQEPRWMRFTLSERPSNKPLVFGSVTYGDGRGYPVPFRTGETEDKLFVPAGGGHDGPDLAVRLAGRIKPNGAAVQFKVEVANRGSQPADGAVLTFQKPPELRDQEIVLLQAPGIPSEAVQDTGDSIQFLLPHLEQDNIIAILIGLTIPTQDGGSKDIAASASVDLNGDVDPNNNEASVTVHGQLHAPLIGAFMDYTDDALLDSLVTGRATTCSTTPTLGGQAQPGQMVEIMIDGQVVGTVQADGNGRFHYEATLGEGLHRIAARTPRKTGLMEEGGIFYLRLKVDPTLPIDPLSLNFTDSQGQMHHAELVAGSLQDAEIDGLALHSGESYTATIKRCAGDPNLSIQLLAGDVPVSTLHDDDGDGRYSGSFTPEIQAAAVTANALRLVVTTGDVEQSFTTMLQPATAGIVRDLHSGQPLANVQVTAHAVASLAALEPQLTNTNGAYSFSAPNGRYQLEAVVNGYQPYRTGELAVTGGTLAQEIALTPAIEGAAQHTVYRTATGFAPGLLNAQPGDVIEWVNVDLADHALVRSGDWDSGWLAPGEHYQVRVDAEGSYAYQDADNPLITGIIRVAAETGSEPTSAQLFLPLVTR